MDHLVKQALQLEKFLTISEFSEIMFQHTFNPFDIKRTPSFYTDKPSKKCWTQCKKELLSFSQLVTMYEEYQKEYILTVGIKPTQNSTFRCLECKKDFPEKEKIKCPQCETLFSVCDDCAYRLMIVCDNPECAKISEHKNSKKLKHNCSNCLSITGTVKCKKCKNEACDECSIMLNRKLGHLHDEECYKCLRRILICDNCKKMCDIYFCSRKCEKKFLD
jgi:hypothetical protein